MFLGLLDPHPDPLNRYVTDPQHCMKDFHAPGEASSPFSAFFFGSIPDPDLLDPDPNRICNTDFYKFI
jgi:hypothetical protein